MLKGNKRWNIHISLPLVVGEEIEALLAQYDMGAFGNIPGSLSKSELINHLILLGLDDLRKRHLRSKRE